MSTTANGTTYGSISNAPGRQDEFHVSKPIATKVTAVAASATVAAAEAAIFTVRRADRIPSSNTANKTGRVVRSDY